MAEKRDSRRIPFRTMLSYGPRTSYGPVKRPARRGQVTDLSGTGVCIKTNSVLRPGVELYMNFEVDNKVYTAHGTIMWAKVVPPGLMGVVKNGMGVRFTDITPELEGAYTKKLEIFA